MLYVLWEKKTRMRGSGLAAAAYSFIDLFCFVVGYFMAKAISNVAL